MTPRRFVAFPSNPGRLNLERLNLGRLNLGRLIAARHLSVSLLAATVIAVTLAACTPVTLTATEPSPSASASTPVEPSPSETPSASPSPSAPLSAIPTDCTKVVNPASYDGFFQGTPLNDPGFVDPTLVGPIAPMPPPADALPGEIIASAVELRCIWRDPNADITGISIEYSKADAGVAAEHMTGLASRGFTCSDANGGRQCQLVQPNEQYPVEEAFTVLSRDGVVITVQQANFPTVNLMAALAAAVWGE